MGHDLRLAIIVLVILFMGLSASTFGIGQPDVRDELMRTGTRGIGDLIHPGLLTGETGTNANPNDVDTLEDWHGINIIKGGNGGVLNLEEVHGDIEDVNKVVFCQGAPKGNKCSP